ncbi:hypothetical protein BRC93_05045 [Halobacteriales archaeon QS_5_70_15]|nr:MAG: hypothetical protein BRC93_05045 [Halobacteriales archaeon QS_5_70_15]
MSSQTQSIESNDLPHWDDLTRARRRLLRIIGYFRGPAVLERPTLRAAVEDTPVDDVEEVIDDKERILKTLNSCGLLNKLTEEDGYLEKRRQGGGNPIVVDYEYDEERDTCETTVYSETGKIDTMATDILSREGKSVGRLDGVDMSDPKAIIGAVNGIVGRQVLRIHAEASRYCLVPEAVPTVEANLNTSLGEGMSNDDS